jgi:hypothetical protein
MPIEQSARVASACWLSLAAIRRSRRSAAASDSVSVVMVCDDKHAIPTRQGVAAELVRCPPRSGAVSPDYDRKLAASRVLDHLDERLPPQELVDAIAVVTPDCATADALVILAEADRGSYRLPPSVITFTCEVCGAPSVIQGRRRHWVAEVPWLEVVDDIETVIELIGKPHAGETAADISEVRRLRWKQPDGPVSRGGIQVAYRSTLACGTCIRRDTQSVGLRRCRHESVDSAGDWRRCRQIVDARSYCTEHAAMKRERRAGTVHRRGEPDIAPLVVTASDRGRFQVACEVSRRLAGHDSAWFAKHG